MNKRYFLILFLLLFCFSCRAKQTPFPSQVAGMFYPQEKEELLSMINKFLQKSPVLIAKETEIKGLICPHAGYIYCGQVASYAYKQIQGRDFSTVIILAPSHYTYQSGASIYPEGLWTTPLGNVEIDSEIARKIISASDLFKENRDIFQKEHSIEVQIPFLQVVLKNFKIVPIIINTSSIEVQKELAKVLSQITKDEKVLIIASSDMSHYHPYEQAIKIDNLVIQKIKNYDLDGLQKIIERKEGELCGASAVSTLLWTFAQENSQAKFLKYANSGDVVADKNRVVGYSSFAIIEEEKMGGEFSKQQKETLLKIARQTIIQYMNEGKKPEFEITDEKLKEKRGVFVTLHKNGELRGCIGYIFPVEELYKAVGNMAIESAFNDPRFPPVTSEELNDLKIEISVLSVPKKVESVDEIQLGKHGVIVRRGMRQGVFLPQVAEETGWTKEEFLSHLCADKAFLPWDAWKDKDTELLIFTAEIFSE